MAKNKHSKKGNDIEIDYEKHLEEDRFITNHLKLRVVSLSYMSADDDEWRGKWHDEDIWVKFTRPGHEIIFSKNFPEEHMSSAREEVERIVKQFD